MAEASIPVHLFNPGQVFACLGFLEAAEVLLSNAEGGFDWSNEAHVRFILRAAGDENPFAVVLRFLAEAKVRRCAPIGYTDPPTKKKAPAEEDGDNEEDLAIAEDLRLSESFPDYQGDRMALPIRLELGKDLAIELGHWADGSRRNAFKLYSGNRSAYSIACAMLHGTRKKPGKKQKVGDVNTQGIDTLWQLSRDDLLAKPFDVLTLMGGSFNFDPRGAWTALDAGYSPNQHKHGIAASPVVEILAALGLENARPEEYETRQVRYTAWSSLVQPILARPLLAGSTIAVPVRRFRFVLDLSGKNKVVTFAQEETNA
jgi:CRISPR-associated protein Csb3